MGVLDKYRDQRVCARSACGHHWHSHIRGGGFCTVTIVSGPPTPPELVNKSLPLRADATDAELHPGRTVTHCECPGFLS